MGLEPTTATLATWRSTTELHPHRGHCLSTTPTPNCKAAVRNFKGEKTPAPASPGAHPTNPVEQGLQFPPALRVEQSHVGDAPRQVAPEVGVPRPVLPVRAVADAVGQHRLEPVVV